MGKYFLPRLDNLAALFPENGAQLAALPLEEFVRRIPQVSTIAQNYWQTYNHTHRSKARLPNRSQHLDDVSLSRSIHSKRSREGQTRTTTAGERHPVTGVRQKSLYALAPLLIVVVFFYVPMDFDSLTSHPL